MPEQGCVITQTNNTVLAATFIYGMCFDLVVLVLTAAKLAFQRGQRSALMKMLFRDGLIYFVIAFVASLLATTFMLLNLNAIMSVIFNVPSAVASTVRAFPSSTILVGLTGFADCRMPRRPPPERVEKQRPRSIVRASCPRDRTSANPLAAQAATRAARVVPTVRAQ